MTESLQTMRRGDPHTAWPSISGNNRTAEAGCLRHACAGVEPAGDPRSGAVIGGKSLMGGNNSWASQGNPYSTWGEGTGIVCAVIPTLGQFWPIGSHCCR